MTPKHDYTLFLRFLLWVMVPVNIFYAVMIGQVWLVAFEVIFAIVMIVLVGLRLPLKDDK